MTTIYYSKSNDPYQNIASEYSILQNLDDPALFLWSNRPCVIAGKNQNTYAEWDLNYIRQLNILPVRRLTGGGCVYHDLGNLNFSFFGRQDTSNEYFLGIILKALKNFNIDATISGRNDLCICDKKFGGTAYLLEDGKKLVHGTLMVDVNIDILTKVLQPNVRKYEDRGISSVKSRVINLSEISSQISTSALAKAIEETYRDEMEAIQIADAPIDMQLSKKLASRDWIYGDYANGESEFHFKTKKGVITAIVKNRDGLIEQVRIYTDSMEISWTEQLEAHLRNKPVDKIKYYIDIFLYLT